MSDLRRGDSQARAKHRKHLWIGVVRMLGRQGSLVSKLPWTLAGCTSGILQSEHPHRLMVGYRHQ
jgi:hypothetical protein